VRLSTDIPLKTEGNPDNNAVQNDTKSAEKIIVMTFNSV
jgi:hypothetical protein